MAECVCGLEVVMAPKPSCLRWVPVGFTQSKSVSVFCILTSREAATVGFDSGTSVRGNPHPPLVR
jgi:hypothetical protein